MRPRPSQNRRFLLAAVLLLVAAASLGGCGRRFLGRRARPTAAGRPPAAPSNYPLTANPVSIEPLNAQESEGMQVAHQVFEGLAG